jgi:hypothetical protein
MIHHFGVSVSTLVVWGNEQQEYIKKMVNENNYFISETSVKRTMNGTEKVTVLVRLTTMAKELIPGSAAITVTER